MSSTWLTWYYDQDRSLRTIPDSAGNVVKRVDYDSFGNIINDTNLALVIPFGFAGGLHDRDTGLVRFGFRDYDPDTGRWSAKDPILFRSSDTYLYGYVLNDPVNLVDPTGLDACDDFVDSLIRDCTMNKKATDLGQALLDQRSTTLKDVSGFKSELVSSGQRGAVSRHIYGHAGAVLRYGAVVGSAGSYANRFIDYYQRFQEGRKSAESEAEIAGDIAGRAVGAALREAKAQGACSAGETRQGLKDILCQ